MSAQETEQRLHELVDVAREALLALGAADGGSAPIVLTLRLEHDESPVVATVRATADGEITVEPAAADTGFDLADFLLRLPQAVLAVDRHGRVTHANRRARTLLAPARIRVGAELPDEGAAGAVRGIVERLTVRRLPLPAGIVHLDEGRTLRVSGTPVSGDWPAIIQLEEVTVEWQQEQRKREFVRNAAHQLRTPLAAISSAVEVLESGGKDDPEIRDRFLTHIRTHSERLNRLTRALLVLARLEAGELTRLEPVELRPLLDALAGEAADSAPVRVTCPPEAAVLGDRDLLHEALAALVDNAVKHAGTKVEVAVDDDLAIHVVDTGPGIPAELRARVLEPFFHSGAGAHGFGLGLAIAARAVEAMGGALSVDDVEYGTRVSVRLKAAR